MTTPFGYDLDVGSIAGTDLIPIPTLSGSAGGASALRLRRIMRLPLRRTGRGGFEHTDYIAGVLSHVGRLLATEEGSLAWDPTYGSKFHLIRQRPATDTVTRALARVYATDAIALWEPRARVAGVETIARDIPGRGVVLHIRVGLTILAPRTSSVLSSNQIVEVRA